MLEKPLPEGEYWLMSFGEKENVKEKVGMTKD
jgi:hypothetical protein